MNKEDVLALVHRLCPEVEMLGFYTVVVGKGRRY